MASRHIAFFLEHAYGQIIPTLGLSAELMRRGHRVSYAVTASFASAITRFGARPIVFQPLDTRPQLFEYTARADGGHDFNLEDAEFMNVLSKLRALRTEDSLRQLEQLYAKDRPDVVIHDDCLDFAGKELAKKWDIPKVLHVPDIPDGPPKFPDDEPVLISVPRFFHQYAEQLGSNVSFVGFNPEGRREFFKPWKHTRQ